jgi:hypothetical protein
VLSSWLRKRDNLKLSTLFLNPDFGDPEEFLALSGEQKLLGMDELENERC